MRDGGQAAVETALTIPLFMFVLMGSLQLALMHQARLLAKYAAYKAVRIGALTSVDLERMERAALAVVLPTIKAQAAVYKTTNASDFSRSFDAVSQNEMPEDRNMKYVEILVCSPNKELLGGGDEHDFDSEAAVGSSEGRTGDMSSDGWKQFDRGRLAIQLTYNYRMIIPFADMMLYLITTGQERADLMWTFKLGKQDPQVQQQAALAQRYAALASNGQYVLPIRTNYVMRMQSSLFPNASKHGLPDKNECVLRFPKKGEGGGGTGSGTDDVDSDETPEAGTD